MKVAIYPGSFNPFHKGHYNILRKAEAIFDKVIVCRGLNPNKSDYRYPMPKLDCEVMKYRGLLTDFISEHFDDDVVVIRGLRNATDLQYELIQYRFLQDLRPNIKVISLFCDKEYEHISSSAIRQLELYGKADKYLLK